jgi:hypothetical protein
MTDDLNKLEDGIGEKIGMLTYFLGIFIVSHIGKTAAGRNRRLGFPISHLFSFTKPAETKRKFRENKMQAKFRIEFSEIQDEKRLENFAPETSSTDKLTTRFLLIKKKKNIAIGRLILDTRLVYHDFDPKFNV